MAYNEQLAARVRAFLEVNTRKLVKEKKMFGGLAFLVAGKMCINISGDNLMCRIDPFKQPKLEKQPGYLPMVMRGKVMSGYCLVTGEGYPHNADLAFWVKECLDFNDEAKISLIKNNL